jgi:toxin FitB
MFLVDTNVVSELRKVYKGTGDRHVAAWAQEVDSEDLYLSVLTIHELELGTLLMERRDPVQGRMLREWLRDYVMVQFSGRLLPIDLAVVQRNAPLHVPKTCSLVDGLIAATALVHNMTVVTRNSADFVATGVPLFNPWEASSERL